MEGFQQSIKEFGMKFLGFAVVLVLGVVAVKLLLMLIKRVLGKTSFDRTVKSFLFSVVRVLLYAVVVVTALGTAGVDISSLLTALGAAALTASLALQDTLKNFVSGMIILLNKPFTSGDWIQADGCEGTVDTIRIFYTQIHTFDNRVVQIPNSKMTSTNVTNCSSAGTRRVDLKFSVSYEDNLTQVKSVIYGVIAKNALVLTDPEPKVYVSKHLDNGVEITVFVWTMQENYFAVQFQMEEDVKNAFDENGVTIPYPHVEIVGKNA